jgi:hypothetical protein
MNRKFPSLFLFWIANIREFAHWNLFAAYALGSTTVIGAQASRINHSRIVDASNWCGWTIRSRTGYPVITKVCGLHLVHVRIVFMAGRFLTRRILAAHAMKRYRCGKIHGYPFCDGVTRGLIGLRTELLS